MKAQIGIYLSIALGIFGAINCGSNGNSSANNPPGTIIITIPASAISLGPAAYGTNPFHVPVGSNVAWTNADSTAHTATSDTGVFDTSGIGPGSTSAAVAFNTAGNFPYHCSIHGAAHMSGTIVVP